MRGKLVICLGAVLTAAPVAMSQFVTLEGRRFMLNGQQFYPKVMNMSISLATSVVGGSDEYYFSKNHVYGVPPDGDIKCPDASSCEADLLDAFSKIADMGFNTVRLVAVGPEMRMHQGQGQFYLAARQNAPSGWDPWPPISVPLEESAGFHGPISDGHFMRLRGLLDLAQAAGLKVILLSLGAPKGSGWCAASDMNAVQRASIYYHRLAEELNDHPALLAYDLWNEPFWHNGGFRQWNKNDVCSITAEWYDSIKSADENHLITLGFSAYEDLGGWEPNAMKLDFGSVHFYPDNYDVDGYNFQTKTNRAAARLYWCAVASPMPYIVGETAFSADDSPDDFWPPIDHLDGDPAHHAPPWMDGTEAQQAIYADNLLYSTWLYRGSGFSWWEFQNSAGGSLNDPPGDYKGKFYAPLRFGYTDAQTGNVVPWVDKEVVGVFEDYEYSGLLPSDFDPPPPSQYTMGRYNGSLNSGAVVRTIQVRDQHDNAVEGSVLWQKHKYYNTSNNSFAREIENECLGTSEGSVFVRKGPAFQNYYAATHEVRFSIPGGRAHQFASSLTPPSTFVINRERLQFREVVSGEVVAIGVNKDVRAWSEIGIDNLVVLGNGELGGTLEAHCRDYVWLSGEVHIQVGSEAHLFLEPIWPRCGSGSLSAIPLENGGNEAEVVKNGFILDGDDEELDLEFDLHPSDFQVSVLPNPFVSSIVLWVEGGGYEYVVHTSEAKVIESGYSAEDAMTLDLSGFGTGVYTVSVERRSSRKSLIITKTH